MSCAGEEAKRLAKLPPSEPVFVLRAQDLLAAMAVRGWIDLASVGGVSLAKLTDAELCAQAMEKWPHRRMPD